MKASYNERLWARWGGKQAYWRAMNLRSKYGICVERGQPVPTGQDGKCEICGTDKPGGRNNILQADHCHISGRVRGWLCCNCNMMLGHAKDSPGTLEKAIAYLRKLT
jgi:hypothetical protein